MAQIATIAIKTLEALLRAPTGLAKGLAAVRERSGASLAPLQDNQLVGLQVAPEIAEKSGCLQYPTFLIYCERLNNTLREKFRRFSGTATITIEVRVTTDRIETLSGALQHYVDGLTETLDSLRGDWGEGQFYAGGYQIVFGPAKTGGKNYLQVAKATFDLQISK
jgi:hypothetical protein